MSKGVVGSLVTCRRGVAALIGRDGRSLSMPGGKEQTQVALLKKREKTSVDRRQSLAGVPVLHDNVEILEGQDGVVTLKLYIPRGRGFLDRFRPPVMERKYELDEFGAFVVQQVQKRKDVLTIIRAFERRFGMSHRESELGVVAFVKTLMKRNVLSVVVK